MYIIKQTFKKNIMVNNNIIEHSINLEDYIENFINTELLFKNINGYITLKLKKYKYIYPKLITNKLYIHNKYIITSFIEFETLKFFKNQVLDNFKLSDTNKFDDLIFLYNDFNENIKITAVDINNSIQYKKNNNLVRILKINYINNIVNLIVEKVDHMTYFGHISYFKNNIDNLETYKLDISPFLTLTKDYKFNISIYKKKETLTMQEIIDKLIKLPKKNTFIITFNKNNIEITEYDDKNGDILYNGTDIYLINTLIEFNNYCVISNTSV